MSLCGPMPSWVHPSKPDTAGVKSASPPFLLFFWGPWLLQFPLSPNPAEPPIPAAFFPTFLLQLQAK